MIGIASGQEVLDAFRWNDASSAWVMLGVSFLFHLYTRYITEVRRFSGVFVSLFAILYLASVSLALNYEHASFIESPLFPTMVFSAVWFSQFLAAIARFWRRRCPHCASRMEVVSSDLPSLSTRLRRISRVVPDDLWFCRHCRFAKTAHPIERRCPSCRTGPCALDTVQMITTPTTRSFGVVRLASSCRQCSARLTERALVPPLAAGSPGDRQQREQGAAERLDRLEIPQEFWNRV